MADVSRTQNLDSFQSKFNRVTDAGHEVEAKLNRRGEAFLVKGRGKSKKSRVWFAIKHPGVYHRDKNVQTKHRAVVLALKTAAKRDFGAKGPRLVEAYMRSHGMRKTEKLSPQQLGEITKFLKDYGNLVSKNGTMSEDINAYLKTHVGQNILIKYLQMEFSPEHAFFVIDFQKAMDILNGNAAPEVKRAVFDIMVERYFRNTSDLQINLENVQLFRNVLRHCDINGSFTNAQLNAVKRDLKVAFQEIKKMITNDNFLRLSRKTPRLLRELKLEGLDRPPDRYTFKIEENNRLVEKNVAPLNLEMVEDRARNDMRRNRNQNVGRNRNRNVQQNQNQVQNQNQNVQRNRNVRNANRNDAPDPLAKLKKVLNRTPGIKNHPQLKNLTNAELNKINEMFSDDTELTAINKVKKLLGDKAKEAQNVNRA